MPTDDLCNLRFSSHLSCAGDGKKEMDLTENVRIELLEKSDRDPNSRWQPLPTHISTKLRQHNSRCTRLSQYNSACVNLCQNQKNVNVPALP